MGIHVTIGEAEKRLAELLAAATRGEEVVLLREGERPVRLVPVEEVPPFADADREAVRARRLAAIGAWRDAFDGTSIDVRALRMSEAELEERERRKFGAAD
ncbi:MAG: hypothetical protein PGN23_12100 [Sphingomonas adhaesiva]|uniref:type II toxin-antitoxin system Phd/YefM family antitoxin n=1 Tax=Sphingomonas adhaesiva TaxID=28212 RepID=UPI002FF619D5